MSRPGLNLPVGTKQALACGSEYIRATGDYKLIVLARMHL